MENGKWKMENFWRTYIYVGNLLRCLKIFFCKEYCFHKMLFYELWIWIWVISVYAFCEILGQIFGFVALRSESASTFDIISYLNEMPSQFSTHLRITRFGFMISIYCMYQVSVCLPYCKKCDTSNHLNHSAMFFVVFFIIEWNALVYFNHFFENRFIKYGKIREIFGVATYIFSGMPVIYWSMNFFSIFNYESSILWVVFNILKWSASGF